MKRLKASRVRRARAVLSAFKSMNEKQVKELLPFMTDESIDVLSECIYNTLFSSAFPFTKGQRKKITQTFNKIPPSKIRKLTRPDTDIAYKRKAFQSGQGIVTALVG